MAWSEIWQLLLLLSLWQGGIALQVLRELPTMPASSTEWLSRPAGRSSLEVPNHDPGRPS